MSTAAARRAYNGPTLFTYGFRPFFLAGSAWAALAVPLWVWSFLAGGPGALTRDWHVHEMLFGFLAAVMAGFLTTAVPNWTGRMPVVGAPLALLAGLWLAGRLTMLCPAASEPLAGIVDSAFLVVFAAIIWREVIAGRNWRNLPVCGLASTFALANVAFHLNGGLGPSGLGERLALGVAATLIAFIGGRIVPSFTRNWLKSHRLPEPPRAIPALDMIALGLTAIGGLAWAAAPSAPATGALLVLAGAGNLLRLTRWSGWRAGREPMVWVLHAGFAWLGAGLLLLGAAVLTPLIARPAGVHALTAGAIGVMTLAVMTRATRGHTGRPLAADRATLAIYIVINLAAAVRVAAPFFGALQPTLLEISAALWMAAFGGFVAAYGPMLTHRKPATQ
jgi:uncharacterized protein involved in response to NO